MTHFTRARTRFDLERGIETSWCNITPKATCKYLGVTTDLKLRWKPHIDEIQRKVTRTLPAHTEPRPQLRWTSRNSTPGCTANREHNMDAAVRILASTNAARPGPDGVDVAPDRYVSPLCNIRRSAASQAAVQLHKLEYIPPFVKQPWSVGPRIYIDHAEDAHSRHTVEMAKPTNLCICADGGGIGGHVGAAAVWPSANRTESAYMRTDVISTVYAVGAIRHQPRITDRARGPQR